MMRNFKRNIIVLCIVSCIFPGRLFGFDMSKVTWVYCIKKSNSHHIIKKKVTKNLKKEKEKHYNL